MQLTLYKNIYKRKNSTKLPPADAWKVTGEVHLKRGTSFDSPVFLIKGFDGDMPDMNYCKYRNRYYFIRDRIAVNDELFELHCETDYLATFRNDILNYTAFVERAASSYDPFINDTALSSKQLEVYHAEASTSIGISQAEPRPFIYYLVRVIGYAGIGAEGSAQTAENTYIMSSYSLGKLLDFAFTSGNFPVDEITDDLKKLIFNPFQYIVSVMALPWTLPGAGLPAEKDIWLGYYNTGVKASPVPQTYTRQYTLNMPAPFYHDDFRAFNSAYSLYNIYIPGVGTMPIEAADIKEGLTLNVNIDFQTGQAMFVLGRGTSSVIATFIGQAAVPIQISQLGSISGNIIQTVTDTINGAVGGFTSGLLGGAAGGVFGAVAGAVPNMVQGAIHVAQPTPSLNGTVGNLSQLLAFPNVYISLTAFGSADFPLSHYGRPLCQNKRLGDISGFCKCAAASINISGTSADKEAVNTYLNSGFYIE